MLRDGVIGDVYMAKGLCYKRRDTIGKAVEEKVPEGVHYDLVDGARSASPIHQEPLSLPVALAVGLRAMAILATRACINSTWHVGVWV